MALRPMIPAAEMLGTLGAAWGLKLETESWKGLRHRHKGESRRKQPLPFPEATAPVPYSTPIDVAVVFRSDPFSFRRFAFSSSRFACLSILAFSKENHWSGVSCFSGNWTIGLGRLVLVPAVGREFFEA
jgi:hypothetical protein